MISTPRGQQGVIAWGEAVVGVVFPIATLVPVVRLYGDHMASFRARVTLSAVAWILEGVHSHAHTMSKFHP